MKLQFKISFPVLLVFMFSAIAYSQSLPTPDEALKVLNFYNDGKGEGVILMESKICHDIHKSGAAKYDCKNEVIEFGPLSADGTPPEIFHKISKEETVYIWMSLMVPKGAKEEIYLRYNLDGDTRRTSGELTVKGSLRYRTWSNFTPDESGDWEIEIFHKRDDAGPELLTSLLLTVE